MFMPLIHPSCSPLIMHYIRPPNYVGGKMPSKIHQGLVMEAWPQLSHASKHGDISYQKSKRPMNGKRYFWEIQNDNGKYITDIEYVEGDPDLSFIHENKVAYKEVLHSDGESPGKRIPGKWAKTLTDETKNQEIPFTPWPPTLVTLCDSISILPAMPWHTSSYQLRWTRTRCIPAAERVHT